MQRNCFLFQYRWCPINLPIYRVNESGSITESIGQHPEDPRNMVGQTIQAVNPIVIRHCAFLLYFTQENAAHSICQLIRSLYEYVHIDKQPTIYMSQCIQAMPFLHKLIGVLLPGVTIHYIQENQLYYFEEAYLPKYVWFTNTISYKSTDLDLGRALHTNTPISPEYGDLYEPLLYFDQRIEQIHEENKARYPNLPAKVCLIKTTQCTDSVTPHRAITFTESAHETLRSADYIMILPHQIDDVVKHIVMLRSADVILTSYGGANCCNRFFFSPASDVKVICNTAYRSEYTLEWHPRCSAYRARSYTFYFDQPNTMTAGDLSQIILDLHSPVHGVT